MSYISRNWLSLLNFVILQWFFVRLSRVKDDQGNTEGYMWLYPITPLTGWIGRHVFVHEWWPGL